jgi:hypothetical protein
MLNIRMFGIVRSTQREKIVGEHFRVAVATVHIVLHVIKKIDAILRWNENLKNHYMPMKQHA